MNLLFRLQIYLVFFALLLSKFSIAAAHINQDTVVTIKDSTNASFNSAYRETINPGFFGNEYGNPIKTSLVADLNPNVILLNSSKTRFFVLFSPRVKLRLLDARKAPVRSPSYMPGLKVFTRLNDEATRPRIISLAYSHHSNGQDGPTLDSLGAFNRGKGKFTTNYYTLDYIFGKRSTGSLHSSSRYGSIGIEIHTGLFNVGYSKELKDQYGFARLNGNWIYNFYKSRHMANQNRHQHRIHANFTYILDNYQKYSFTNAGKRLNTNLQYNFKPGFAENVALMIGAGYRGQDDYNIYFQDSYSYLTIGVVYGVTFTRKIEQYKTRNY